MKKAIILLFFIFWIKVGFTHGIDGCSMGGVLNGVNQVGTSNYFGIQNIFFNSSSPFQDIWGNMQFDKSFGSSSSISGRYYYRHKIGLSATLNYTFYNETTQNLQSNFNGLGDSRLQIELPLLHKMENGKALFIGIKAGIEIPTGKVDDEIVLRNFSPGSGSWDFPIAAQIFKSNGKIGFNSKLFYQFNRFNQNGFSFGNQLNFNISLFKIYDLNKGKLSFSTSAQFLHFSNDQTTFQSEIYSINNSRSFGLIRFNSQYTLKKTAFQLGISKSLIYHGNNLFQEQPSWLSIGFLRTLKHC